MAGSLFCLLVLVITIVGHVSALQTLPNSEPEFRAAMMKRLHKNGPPDLVAMKAAYDARPQPHATATYTSYGYIASGFYTDEKCTVMDLTIGTPVNTCFVEEQGYAYMFRLTQDSCIGAVIEYYFDKECTILAGTSAPSDPVVPYPVCSMVKREISAMTVCSSGYDPWVAQEAYVEESYEGDSCGGAVGYKAYPANYCYAGYSYDDSYGGGDDNDFMFTCGFSRVTVNFYELGSGCTQLTQSIPVPMICLEEQDDDDFSADDDFFNDDNGSDDWFNDDWSNDDWRTDDWFNDDSANATVSASSLRGGGNTATSTPARAGAGAGSGAGALSAEDRRARQAHVIQAVVKLSKRGRKRLNHQKQAHHAADAAADADSPVAAKKGHAKHRAAAQPAASAADSPVAAKKGSVKHRAAAKKAHPAAVVHPAASGPVPSMSPAPIPATTPGTTQTDDDVNYYDDDGDDRAAYTYDDYVYIYPHDDQDFGYQFYWDDDGISYDDQFEPPLNPPPSISGTPFPTVPAELNPNASYRIFCQYAPAQHNAVFSVSQTFEGVSVTQFTSDLPAYTRTVAQTVAAVVTGATQSSVTNLVVTGVPTTAAASPSALHALLPAAFRLAAPSLDISPLSASEVMVSYTVTVKGAILSTDTLAGQLQLAVTGGTFDQYLNSFALANGATGLQTATSTVATTQSLPDASSDTDGAGGSSGSSDDLSAGAIAGIVIGCVAGAALIVAGVVFLLWKRPSSGMAASASATENPVRAAKTEL